MRSETWAQIRRMEFLPADWTREDSERILPLPKGWRWLRRGEIPRIGDMLHDPRCRNAVKQVEDWPKRKMDSKSHPIRRRIKS